MTNTKFTFDFNWKLSLSVLFVFPALICLSAWQMDRAAEKKAIGARWKEQQQALAELFNPEKEYAQYQRLTMRGQFLTKQYWLKENQFYLGRLGYSVIMPFALESGLTVAVDRGWVKGSPMRDFVPTIKTPKGVFTLSGTLVDPSDSSLIQESDAPVDQWPHKILELDLDIMSAQIGSELYRHIIRVDADSAAALVLYWRPTNTSPAKHYGYAVQWALLALALIVLYVFASSNLAQWIKSRSN